MVKLVEIDVEIRLRLMLRLVLRLVLDGFEVGGGEHRLIWVHHYNERWLESGFA